jgi:hypothetical protein
MNSMWSKRNVVVAIALIGAAGRLSGCATMGGSTGHMMYDLPFVIAESNEDLQIAAVRPGPAIDPYSGTGTAG